MAGGTRVYVAGDNQTRLWYISSRERVRRMVKALGWELVDRAEDARVLVNDAFAFDMAWLKHVAALPDRALTLGGVPVIACVSTSELATAVAAQMQAMGTSLPPAVGALPAESGTSIMNEALRKREVPFVLPLTPATVGQAERASYVGAYKGVTDLLTKYLWPEWAFHLTRLAARIGLSPNMVTTIGAIFCVIATLAFVRGDYWLGLATGLFFMVLDTVDGKLARCTITSSWWGNIFDHGMDLIHPPIWWWAWAVGLAAYGTPLSSEAIWWSLGVIVVGYVVQRLIEGAFIKSFGMHIHVWERLDSQFRLITARRNPNMVILFASLLVGRPDWGLLALAWWTGLSCFFHLVRLFQAYARRGGGRPIVSWLAD